MGLWSSGVALACLPLAAQTDRQERLRALGEACLRYADAHGGRLPASLRDLYYEAYVNDLAVFGVPGSAQTVVSRDRIDEQSGYALTPGAVRGAGAMPVVAERPAGGGAEVQCFFGDRTIRAVAAAAVFPQQTGQGKEIAPQPPPAPTPKGAEVFTQMERWGARRIEVEEGTPFSEQLLRALAPAQGIRIEAAAEGTVAALLGLQVGDLLVGMEGRPLSSQRDLANVLASVPENAPVLLTVVRNGALRVYRVGSGTLPRTAREVLAKADAGKDGGGKAAPTPTSVAGQEATPAVPWPDVGLWDRALRGLRSQVMIYDSKEGGQANFRERTDKGHLPDGSLVEFRYWLADNKWRMSRALFKSDAGRQDWLMVEFNDDGAMWAVHHGLDEAGNWRESLHDNDLNGRPEAFSVDVNGDGKTDFFGTDTDGDGRVDQVAR